MNCRLRMTTLVVLFQLLVLLGPHKRFNIICMGRSYTSVSKQLANCAQIRNGVVLKSVMEGGFVKRMHRGYFRGLEVVYSEPRSTFVVDDFRHGVEMLIKFLNSDYTIQLLGYCLEDGREALLTKWYKYGSVENMNHMISYLGLSGEEVFAVRLQLAESFLSVMEFLHNSPHGTRVMCDSNDLNKTLSQFVISDNMHVLLADLDALPEVSKSSRGIKCGHRQLFGTFVAPEQLWPWPDLPFNDTFMPSYDEKIDIWKIPDVVSYFLGTQSHAVQMKLALFEVFQECKSINSSDRPSVEKIRDFFRSIKDTYFSMENVKHFEL